MIINCPLEIIYLDNEPTTYVCDELGNIYNTKRKGHGYKKEVCNKLKPIKLPNGYCVVTLSVNGVTTRDYIHRIIAKTFIPIPYKYLELGLTENDLEVNHKNGDKSDNSVSNLEWSTDSDNKIHAYSTNLSKQCEDSCKSIYTNSQIHLVCKYLEEDDLTPLEIYNLTGVHVHTIHDIKNKASWVRISSMYDFSNYTPKQYKYSKSQIDKVKSMLKENKYTARYISSVTGVKERTVYMYKDKLKLQK